MRVIEQLVAGVSLAFFFDSDHGANYPVLMTNDSSDKKHGHLKSAWYLIGGWIVLFGLYWLCLLTAGSFAFSIEVMLVSLIAFLVSGVFVVIWAARPIVELETDIQQHWLSALFRRPLVFCCFAISAIGLMNRRSQLVVFGLVVVLVVGVTFMTYEWSKHQALSP